MKTKFTLLTTLALLFLFNFSNAQCVIEIKQPAQLTAQIQNVTQEICSGTEVTFDITFSGGTQPWSLTIGGNLIDNNITIPTYSYTTTLTANATFNNTNVEVSDANSCTGIVSGEAAYTVYPVITITTHPTATVDACQGTAIPALSVTATGGNSLTYQWQQSDDNTAYTDIIGETGTTYTPSTATVGTKYYRVVVSSATTGCNSATSSYSVVNVYDNISITEQPTATVDACQGSTIPALSVTATGGNALTYQWQQSDDNATYTDITGETGTTYTPSTATVGTKYYRVVITSATSGCGSVTSSYAVVTIYDNITITEQPVGKNVCSGSTAQLSVTASGGGTLKYQWQKYNTTTNTWENIAGATSSTYTTVAQTPAAGTTAETQYRVLISSDNAIGCGETTSNEVTVLTSGGPTFTTDFTNVSCYGGSDGSITVTATAGLPNFTVKLYTGNTAIEPPTSTGTINAVNGTHTFNGLSASSYTITVTDTHGCVQNDCPNP